MRRITWCAVIDQDGERRLIGTAQASDPIGALCTLKSTAYLVAGCEYGTSAERERWAAWQAQGRPVVPLVSHVGEAIEDGCPRYERRRIRWALEEAHRYAGMAVITGRSDNHYCRELVALWRSL